MAERAAATEAKGSPQQHQHEEGEEGEAHQQQHKVPLHRVALHRVPGQPRGNGGGGGSSSNGMPYVVPMDMYKENRAKLCARLQTKVRACHVR